MCRCRVEEPLAQWEEPASKTSKRSLPRPLCGDGAADTMPGSLEKSQYVSHPVTCMGPRCCLVILLALRFVPHSVSPASIDLDGLERERERGSPSIAVANYFYSVRSPKGAGYY